MHESNGNIAHVRSEKLWVGTSWKMNKTLPQARAFVQGLIEEPCASEIQRFVIPPFTVVREVSDLLSQSNVKVGAQNMHWAAQGAWTGEISPSMLIDCGLDLIEIGHSERRTHFGETDATVALKVEAAIHHGLTPLICIGETQNQKKVGLSDQVLLAQIQAALSKLTNKQIEAPMLLAYEPVWAIGTNGLPASPSYAEDRHGKIAEVTLALTGQKIPCLYGGSVTGKNCSKLINCQHIDGLFIGRAAWDISGYLDILSQCTASIRKRRSL